MENVRNDVCNSDISINESPKANGHLKKSTEIKLEQYCRKNKSNSIASSRLDHSSTVKLVMSESISHRKRALWKSIVYWVVIIILALIVIIMSSLYVSELKKEVQIQKIIHKTEIEENEPCFERARPIKLNNLRNEKEILDAIKDSHRRIVSLFWGQKYKALSLSISYMGETVWNISYGGLNFTNHQSAKVTCDTSYPIASISKLITVLAVQILYERGDIESLDDTIQKYDSRFQIVNPFNSKNITIRQLACMMSGLPREAPCNPPESNNLCPYNTSVMFKRLKNTELILPPNTRPHYSNLGISILGRILENVMHNETFEIWVTKNILKPLKMHNTGFNPSKIKTSIPVTNILDKEDDIAQITDWGWLTPAGGMYSSVNDLGKLSTYLLGRITMKKNILSQYEIKKMFHSEYTWPDGTGQGCPFEVSYVDPYRTKRKRLGYMTYSKDGAIFGYGSIVSMVPDLQLALNLIVAEPLGSYISVYADVMQNFVKAFDKLLKRKGEQYTLPANPDFYTGTYKLTTFWPLIRKPCTVTFENNMLYLKLEWFRAPLTFHKNTTLRTGNYGNYILNTRCQFLGIGLLGEKFIFEQSNEGKSPGFYMNGIASYGYVHFKRIT